MPVFDETVNLQQVDTRTGAAQAFRSLGERLGAFKAQQSAAVGQMVDAIQDKNLEARKTALATYEASIDRDLREGFARIAAENPDDLVTFNEKANSFYQSTMGSIPEEYAKQLEDKVLGLMSNYRIGVQTNNINKDRQESLNEINATRKTQAGDALRFARMGDGMETQQALIDFHKTQTNAVDANLMTIEEAEASFADLSKGVAQESFMNQLDMAEEESLDSAVKMLEQWDENIPRGWTPEEWGKFVSTARRDISSKISIRDSQNKASNKILKQKVKDMKEATELGQDIPQEDWAAVGKEVMASGDPEIVDLYEKGNMVIGFSRMSQSQRDKNLEQLESAGAEYADEYIALQKANEKVKAAAKKDGMGLAIRQGFIKENPLETPEDFAKAGMDSLTLSAHYSVNVSPFTEEQADLIATRLPMQTSAEKFALIKNINMMTPEARDAAYDQIAKKGGGMFSVVGAIGDDGIAKQALLGYDMLNSEKPIAKKPSMDDYLSDFNEYIGDVYPTQDASAILETAISMYAVTNPDGVYDRGKFGDIVNSITGGITEYNGKKIQLPRGIDGGAFEDYIDTFTKEGFETLGGARGYTYQQFKEVLDEGQLRSIGNNQYTVIDPFGGEIQKESGGPFIFTYEPAFSGYKTIGRRRQ